MSVYTFAPFWSATLKHNITAIINIIAHPPRLILARTILKKNSVFTLALTMSIALQAPRLDNKCEQTSSLAT